MGQLYTTPVRGQPQALPLLMSMMNLLWELPFQIKLYCKTYQDRQFSWIRTPSDGGTTVRWDLSVLANAENNNTRIKCYFGSAITKEAVLVVVDGE